MQDVFKMLVTKNEHINRKNKEDIAQHKKQQQADLSYTIVILAKSNLG